MGGGQLARHATSAQRQASRKLEQAVDDAKNPSYGWGMRIFVILGVCAMLIVISIVGMMTYADAMARAAMGIFGSFAAAFAALSAVQLWSHDAPYIAELMSSGERDEPSDARQPAAS